MNSGKGGYDIYYGGPQMKGHACPYTWADAVKCMRFHKQNKQIKYIFCIGPDGLLIYRALRGIPGWCAASFSPVKHLLDKPMTMTLNGPAEVLGRYSPPPRPEQIESD